MFKQTKITYVIFQSQIHVFVSEVGNLRGFIRDHFGLPGRNVIQWNQGSKPLWNLMGLINYSNDQYSDKLDAVKHMSDKPQGDPFIMQQDFQFTPRFPQIQYLSDVILPHLHGQMLIKHQRNRRDNQELTIKRNNDNITQILVALSIPWTGVPREFLDPRAKGSLPPPPSSNSPNNDTQTKSTTVCHKQGISTTKMN